MPEAYGAVYRCPKGHEESLYFFDSKPSEIACLRCDGKTMQKRVRELDMKKEAGKRLGEARRNARK